MNRKLERKLIYTASAWQILTGGVTVLWYSFDVRNQAILENPANVVTALGLASYFDSLFMFSVVFGMLFIVVALINIMLVKSCLHDNTLHYKIPIYLFFLGVVFYFLFDFISLVLCMVSGIIILAKNKATRNYCRIKGSMGES